MKPILNLLMCLVAFIAGCIYATLPGGKVRDREGPECKGDTTVMTDTVRIAQPQLKSEANMGKIYMRVARVKGGGAGGLERLCEEDSEVVYMDESEKLYCGGGAGGLERCSSEDSVIVSLPVTQRIYEAEEYRAWVSGVNAELDSIVVYRHRETVKVREVAKRWHIGPTIGVGLCGRGFEPYVGLSVTYSVIGF